MPEGTDTQLMICVHCKTANTLLRDGSESADNLVHRKHAQCPEARRRKKKLTPVELAGSAWCDCQHVLPARPGRSEDRDPTLVG